MKDLVGREIQLGDIVVTGASGLSISLGMVVGFSPKMVRVSHKQVEHLVRNPRCREKLYMPATVCVLYAVEAPVIESPEEPVGV